MYISSVQLLSRVQLFVTIWTTACQASQASITSSRSLLKLMAIESVIPSNCLILCCSLLLLPSIFPSISIYACVYIIYISVHNILIYVLYSICVYILHVCVFHIIYNFVVVIVQC